MALKTGQTYISKMKSQRPLCGGESAEAYLTCLRELVLLPPFSQCWHQIELKQQHTRLSLVLVQFFRLNYSHWSTERCLSAHKNNGSRTQLISVCAILQHCTAILSTPQKISILISHTAYVLPMAIFEPISIKQKYIMSQFETISPFFLKLISLILESKRFRTIWQLFLFVFKPIKCKTVCAADFPVNKSLRQHYFQVMALMLEHQLSKARLSQKT